ncbi:MAG: nuclear transport factor 2 family protein [Acidimicrobiales bacterium]
MTDDNRLAEIEARLATLEAKDEIRALAIRYGEVVDNQVEHELRELFTDDARWAWANGKVDARGIDEVLDALTTRWTMIDASLHVVQGHHISVDEHNARQACGVLFSHAEVLLEGRPQVSALRYDDTYRSVDGSWRFAERVLSFFYFVDAGAYAEELSSGRPVRLGPQPWPSDFPTPAT